MDEVFGDENFCGQILVQKTSGAGSPSIGTDVLASVLDHVIWFAKSKGTAKYRQLYRDKVLGEEGTTQYVHYRDRQTLSDHRIMPDQSVDPADIFAADNLTSPTGAVTTTFEVRAEAGTFVPKKGGWKTNALGMGRLAKADRLKPIGNTLMYRRYLSDFGVSPINNLWRDVLFTGFAEAKVYVVQTAERLIQRCLLMTTDPGDLVLDPTCGSGTTAAVAEQWGRRWITIDTSRVALALARTRLMSARYPYYFLVDSPEGRMKEAETQGRVLADVKTGSDLRQGFVYERAPHVTLKSIANNAEIDVIWEEHQKRLELLRAQLNAALGKAWEEWEIPREADAAWPAKAKETHAAWWEQRIARQKAIDASIAKAADVELLYDRPYVDGSKIRVAGPFTVESLSPHRVVPADEEELMDLVHATEGQRRRHRLAAPPTDFAQLVLEHLRATGVHQAEKRDTIRFESLEPWPGEYVSAVGAFMEGETARRAAIFLGPEFGTLSRVDLAAAAREATEGRFNVLIACAFSFDAHASEMTRLGPMPILKAKMSPDLHMAGDLANTGKGNLFVVFGEPDIDIEDAGDGMIRVRVKGVDVFDPNTGEIRSSDTKGIAAWMIDTSYDHESFFVRHAYFLGAQNPYKSLKAALKAEIDEAAWSTLYSAVSRPFPRPETGKIAVKVINHFGDEVMKVFPV